jgi:hypothetical protein
MTRRNPNRIPFEKVKDGPRLFISQGGATEFNPNNSGPVHADDAGHIGARATAFLSELT